VINKLLQKNSFYVFVLIITVFYSLIATGLNVYSPFDWNPNLLRQFFIYSIGILHFPFINELATSKNSQKKLLRFIEGLTDLSVEKPKKTFDCIFAHLSDVATIGMIFIIIIYSFKDLYAHFHFEIFKYIGAILIFMSFYLYCIILVKLKKSLAVKSLLTQAITIGIMFLVDMQAISIFVKSTPPL
jgi:hypothetical protein